MPRTAVFDFTDTPPEQGGARADRVPPGRYILRITEVKDGTTSAGDKQMVTAWFDIANGDFAGKRLVDRFVRTAPPKNFGWKRFHAFLLAIGLPIQQKAVKLDLDRLSGKLVEAEIQDEVQAATAEYPERTNSVPRSYYPFPPPSANGATPAPATAQSAPPAPAPAPTPAPVAVPAAPAPAPVATPPAPTTPVEAEDVLPFDEAPAAAAAPVEVDEGIQDLDDMFK